MSKSEKQGNHISPHRAWNSVKGVGEFGAAEHEHILHCIQCLRLFLLCLESDSFGAVLKRIDDSAA